MYAHRKLRTSKSTHIEKYAHRKVRTSKCTHIEKYAHRNVRTSKSTHIETVPVRSQWKFATNKNRLSASPRLSVETAESPPPIKFYPGKAPYNKSAHYRCGRQRTLCRKNYQCVQRSSAHATRTTDTPHLMSSLTALQTNRHGRTRTHSDL